MSVRVSIQKGRTISFPTIKISDTGTIVLFTSRSVGMVLVSGDSSAKTVGQYCLELNIDKFNTFDDDIILRNS